MDRLTRKELKTDKFALEVEHTVEYVSEHRRQAILVGGVVLAALLIAAGAYFYRGRQHDQREAALRDAILVQQATIGPAPSPLVKSFPNKTEKDKAADKAFSEVVAKFPGSGEAAYASYMLGNIAVDQGRTGEAEKRYREVIDSGQANYASVAKLSLADLYSTQGKTAEAEQLLRSVMEKPTVLVSKEQATIALADVLAKSKPEEARKLLEPLRTSDRGPVSRAAITELSQLPPPRK